MGKYSDRFASRRRERKTVRGGLPSTMSEVTFLEKRIMFAVVKGELLIAEKTNNDNHRTWLSDLSEQDFRSSPRGFYLNNELVFYWQGFMPCWIGDLTGTLPDLMKRLDISRETIVYNGGRFGPRDAILGQDRLGSIMEVLCGYSDLTIDQLDALFPDVEAAEGRG